MERRHKEDNYGYMMKYQESVVILFDYKNRDILSVNEQFYKYFDKDVEERFKEQYDCICGIFLEEDGFISSANRPDWMEVVERDVNKNYKAKILHKDEEVIFLVKVKQTKRKSEQQFIITLTDITHLENIVKSKNLLLASMTHELRTPLSGIISFSQLLLEANLDETQRAYANTVHTNANGLLYIINDILDLSKLDSGSFEFNFVSTNIRDEIYDVIELFSLKAAEKNISLVPKIDPVLPYLIQTDPIRIKQILNNLLSNAVKFTSETGFIVIEAKYVVDPFTKGHQIIFSIQDSGIGIPEDKISKILEPFEQASSFTGSKFGGTGLGLSIVTNIISKFGSELKVQSEVGKGSTFSFSLPIEISTQVNGPALDLSGLKIGIAVKKENKYLVDVLTLEEQVKICMIDAHIVLSESISKLNECDLVFIFDDMYSQDAINLYRDNLDTKMVIIGKVANKQKIEKYAVETPVIYYPMHTGKIVKTFSNIFLNKVNHIDTQKEYSFSDVNILIAEDNITNQNFIKILLGNLGVDFIIANDGLEVVETYKDNPDRYDIIFMDIMMPHLDGMEATKEIIKYEKENNLKHTPIAALTANALTGDREKYLSVGMNDYLPKPIDKDGLKQLILKYVSKSKVIQISSKVESENSKKSDSKIDYDMEEVASSMSIPIDFIKDLLEMFFSPIQGQLEELLVAIEVSDLEKIIVVSHDIKGASANLRLDEINKVATSMEEDAKANIKVNNLANYEKLKELINNYKMELLDD